VLTRQSREILHFLVFGFVKWLTFDFNFTSVKQHGLKYLLFKSKSSYLFF
jgi:hypothetical protein